MVWMMLLMSYQFHHMPVRTKNYVRIYVLTYVYISKANYIAMYGRVQKKVNVT